MLSICREENYFYSHVLYNIKTWIEVYGNYLDRYDLEEKIILLHEAGTQANSSWDKIELSENMQTTLETIRKNFSMDLNYVKALDKILKNYSEFSTSFQEIIKKLKQIITLELILTNLSLNYYKPTEKYKNRLNELESVKILEKHALIIPNDFIFQSTDEFLDITSRIYKGIQKLSSSLPREESPLLITRLKNQAYQKARNIATIHAYNEGLTEATILYMDFSGLRTIPEPKETIIAEYYMIVEKHGRQRSGIQLYGGKDGDDAFTFLFYDIATAIECVKDIKQDFLNHLFLPSNGDIKFGICTTELLDDKEDKIIRCWGIAKDCCEFKGGTFRNKGNLLVSQETIDFLVSKGNPQESNFTKIDNEELKNEEHSPIYKLIGIEPIKNS